MPGRRIVGVAVGAAKLLAGTVDTDFHVHRRVQRSVVDLKQSSLLATIAEAVQEAGRLSGGEVQAVGFAIPSPIDRRCGRPVSSVPEPLLHIPFGDVMAERLGLPVAVDNDGNLAALAEHRAGAALGRDHALMLTIDAGIGGGLILGGQLYRGGFGAAGELGHIPIDLDGLPCQGNGPARGCLETLVSGPALVREAAHIARHAPDSALARAQARGRALDAALVIELAHDGDDAAREALALIGTRLGIGLAGLVNVFNPEVVVIGGAMIAAGELLLAPARCELSHRALAPARDQVRVVAAHFGVEAAMMGAAVLALDHLHPDERAAG